VCFWRHHPSCALPAGTVSDQHQQTTWVSSLQCLQALPQQTLMHAAQNLKKRAFWLNAEEAAELEVGKYSCWTDRAIPVLCSALLACRAGDAAGVCCNDCCNLQFCAV
jgi:Retinal tissue protein